MPDLLPLDEVSPRVALVAGIVLLVLGRKLYWLLVGLAGFAVGLHLAREALGGQSGTGGWLLALVLASLAALAAVFFQRIAIAAVGFLAGGYLALVLGSAHVSGLALAAVAVGAGVLCALLAKALFEMALVVLSSVLGAGLVAQAQPWEGVPVNLLWAGLAVSGVFLQLAMSSKSKRKSSD